MSTLTAIINLTLDGVMQAPGHPDEDPRDGFPYGGWAGPYASDAMGRLMGQAPGSSTAMLFGRRTYERFADYWPKQSDNPFTEVLNNVQKFVASTTLRAPLPWQNSTVLSGPAEESVSALKQDARFDELVALGSGELLGSLMRSGLVDVWKLLIHPLVLGAGRKLFPDGAPKTALEFVESVSTTTGVIIGTYRAVAKP